MHIILGLQSQESGLDENNVQWNILEKTNGTRKDGVAKLQIASVEIMASIKYYSKHPTTEEIVNNFYLIIGGLRECFAYTKLA